jgi:Protein of unknown function (DUF4127)
MNTKIQESFPTIERSNFPFSKILIIILCCTLAQSCSNKQEAKAQIEINKQPAQLQKPNQKEAEKTKDITKPEISIELASFTTQDKFALKNGFTKDQILNLPPSVLSPRNQTEQRVLETELTLGRDFINNHPLILPERLLQRPELLDQIRDPKTITLAVPFQGIGNMESIDNYISEKSEIQSKYLLEFKKLIRCISILKNRYPSAKIKIVAGQGDSIAGFSGKIKELLDRELTKLSKAEKIEYLGITYGTDELAQIGYANALPNSTIDITITGQEQVHRYDGGMTSGQIAAEKLKQVGLVESKNTNIYTLFLASNNLSKIDLEIEKFAKKIYLLKKADPDIEKKVLIVDSMAPNRSSVNVKEMLLIFQKYSLNYTQFHFSAWGTANNALGDGLARIKIDQYAQSKGYSHSLITSKNLQSFAHDFIFRNQYSQSTFIKYADSKFGLNLNPYQGKFDYEPLDTKTKKQLETAWEGFIAKQMDLYFNGITVDFKYQFPRNFEASIKLTDKQGEAILPTKTTFVK